jgi:hypothetical protein
MVAFLGPSVATLPFGDPFPLPFLFKFFWEGFEVAFYGFADVVEGLFSGFALADCSGELQTLRGVSAFRFFAEDYGEFEAFDFDHKPNQG